MLIIPVDDQSRARVDPVPKTSQEASVAGFESQEIEMVTLARKQTDLSHQELVVVGFGVTSCSYAKDEASLPGLCKS